ncbi:MAG: hypothetical protein KA342_04500 [Aminivibrio sp.]|jgi:hypothetical protein|nr:hypothetical protein [Aminivibrio sp.]
MRMKIRSGFPGAVPFFAALLLAVCWAGGTAAYGAAPALNIPRMIQECPHFSDHPGSDGVIWLKDSEYSLGADGSMNRKTTLVVLARRGIDDRWTRWSIPVPEGGAAEVLSAALYDPGSGRILSPVLPRKGEVNGIPFTEVLFPDIQEEFIIVLSLNEVFPKRFAVEDLLWVNETLPLWEQKVTVNVPAGMELFVAAEGAGEPRREKAAGGEKLLWDMVNSPAWSGRTLKSDDRAFLSFSTRKGTEALARYLGALEGTLVPQPPAAVQAILGQANKLKAGDALIDWMNRAPGFSQGFPPSFVRPDIPGEGPWTGWEKVLLLHRWIRKAGWESRLHWLAAHPFDSSSPAPEAAVIRPVVELNVSGISPFYCDLGQGSSPNETPPSLWGRHLSTPSGSGLQGRTVSGSTAAEHRLSLEWVLDLDVNGVVSGAADILVRNGWVAFFFPGGTPTDDAIARLAAELFPGMRFQNGNASFVPIKYGWKITLPSEPRQSIVSGGAMLVPFSGATPSWLGELGRTSGEYRMRFPFVMEQSFILKLPPKSDVVMMPSTVNRALDRVKYEESVYHNRRRNTLTAGAKIVLSTDAVSDSVGRSLAESVQRWMAYASRTLPLRVK